MKHCADFQKWCGQLLALAPREAGFDPCQPAKDLKVRRHLREEDTRRLSVPQGTPKGRGVA